MSHSILDQTNQRLQKLEDLLEKWIVESTQRPNPTYSQLIQQQEQALQDIIVVVGEMDKKLDTHIAKYDNLHNFVENAVRAKETFEWLGGNMFKFMKFVIYTAATVAAFYALIKGWWAVGIAYLIEPFLSHGKQ